MGFYANHALGLPQRLSLCQATSREARPGRRPPPWAWRRRPLTAGGIAGSRQAPASGTHALAWAIGPRARGARPGSSPKPRRRRSCGSAERRTSGLAAWPDSFGEHARRSGRCLTATGSLAGRTASARAFAATSGHGREPCCTWTSNDFRALTLLVIAPTAVELGTGALEAPASTTCTASSTTTPASPTSSSTERAPRKPTSPRSGERSPSSPSRASRRPRP